MTPTIGSLFSGYGGLDIAAAEAFGATVAWHVEYDESPSKVCPQQAVAAIYRLLAMPVGGAA